MWVSRGHHAARYCSFRPRFLWFSGDGILANDEAISGISREAERGVHVNGDAEHLDDVLPVTRAINFMACEAVRVKSART